MILFLVKAVGVSLSGVLSPGPMTAAALAVGAQRRHAGALMAVGHGIVEFPLMLLILAGMDRLFKSGHVQTAIGLAGGLFLLLMGSQLLRQLGAPAQVIDKHANHNPVWIGIILTGGNPYFLIWWATIGLSLATQARDLGRLAFALFAIVHWLCDVVWLELLSVTSFKGSRLMGGRSHRIVMAACGAAMIVFGAMFIYDAAL